MPNSDSWQIINNGTTPVTITDISTSDMTDDVTKILMQTDDEWQFDDANHTAGHWNFAYENGKDILTKTAGTTDNPLVISKDSPLNCAWDVQITDTAKRSVSTDEKKVGTVSFNFKPIEKTTFAVYSKDDRTLDFYKRLNLPKVGDTFDGKKVDEIFSIDTENGYHQKYKTENTFGVNLCTPWRNLLNFNTSNESKPSLVDTINIVDRISPKSTAWWFMNCGAETLNLANLDMSRCVDAQRMFSTNRITKITGMENWNTSSLENAYAMFDGFYNRMTDISFCKNWNMSKCRNFGAMFFHTGGFDTADFSNWDCSSYDMQSSSDDGLTGSQPIIGATYVTSAAYNVKNIKVSTSAARLGTQLFNIAFTQINHATGKWYSLTDKKAYTVSDIPTDRAGSYTVQLDAGTISGEISGNGVQGYEMTCNATSANFGSDIPLQYRWQKWSGDKTTTWIDISNPSWQIDKRSLVVTETMQGYILRCIVKPATEQYVAGEVTITSDVKCTRSEWKSNTASLFDEGNGKLRVDYGGLPDEEKYGKTTAGITWFADIGPTHREKKDVTMHKSVSLAYTAYNAFTDLNQTTIFPGQTYRLSYDSIQQTNGDNRQLYILLYEWTKSPSSNLVKVLGYLPYSDTSGYVDITIPSDLDKNTWYSLTVTSAGFGQLYDYDGIIKGMAFDCITEKGLVGVQYSGTTNEFDASNYSGHKILASVLCTNRYYKISRKVTDVIVIP